MSLLKNSTFRSAVNNLSSPESAYSTGYSTDGTSPGASIPPEYYINIRTGTHYFHSKPTNSSNSSVLLSPQDFKAGNTSSKVLSGETACKVGSLSQSPVSITVISPRPGRHKREDGTKKKIRQSEEQLPESSTEEDIADRLGNVGHSSPQQMLTPKVCSVLNISILVRFFWLGRSSPSIFEYFRKPINITNMKMRYMFNDNIIEIAINSRTYTKLKC